MLKQDKTAESLLHHWNLLFSSRRQHVILSLSESSHLGRGYMHTAIRPEVVSLLHV